jgi:peptidoglycan-associated lipoprotein
VVAAAEEKTCSADDQCGSKELCVRSRCVAITPALEECGVTRVHFDYDRADLHPGELVKLTRMARCLEADQRIHVLVEGNADERGTVEYNLALGDRRASAVERYLEGLGVGRLQLSTVTYGKEMPLCTEHGESCWSQNRRAALVPGGVPKVVAGEKEYEGRKAARERKERHARAEKAGTEAMTAEH